jgi:hypothetical protein
MASLGIAASLAYSSRADPKTLRAGAAEVETTHPESALVDGPPYSRALVIKSESTTVVLVAMDVVSLGKIGYIKDDFLSNVRDKIMEDLGIHPSHVVINTSHCQGVPSSDTEALTAVAIKQLLTIWNQ